MCGGRQARPAGLVDRSHRALYDQAVLAWLDPASFQLEPALAWRTPEAGAGVGHRFGAASRDGDALVLCTEREVLRFAHRQVTAEARPWMADVHHALAHDGTIWAAATGLDAVHALDGRRWPVDPRARAAGDDARWTELPRARSHPNYLFAWDGTLWVTRGRRGDALAADGRGWKIADVVVHDGVVAEDGVWFTAVDGRLLRVDPRRGAVDRIIDLHRPEDGLEPLGWCRGLCLRDGLAFVGFTRLRSTTWRGRLAWTRGRLRGRPIATRRPSRIVVIELATGRRVAEVETSAVGLDAVFGLV